MSNATKTQVPRCSDVIELGINHAAMLEVYRVTVISVVAF